MLLRNGSKNRISYHDKNKVLKFINIGEFATVDDDIAQFILRIKGVEQCAEKEQVQKLQQENAQLKAQLEEVDLDQLKAEADSLGIEYAKNIGAKTLLKRIQDYKAGK